MSRRVHFVMPDELVDRIDAALPEGVSRGEFVRRAVERALGGERDGDGGPVVDANSLKRAAGQHSRDKGEHRPSPAPAEQSRRARTSAEVRRDVKPIPKRGK